MRLSVVIPCHNAARHLEESVGSVLGQGIEALEIIIVDDASTDDSGAVARRLQAGHPSIRIVALTENAGPARARNIGLATATGAHVCFLDADDFYGPGALAEALGVFDRVPWLGGVHFPLRLISNHRDDVTPRHLEMLAENAPSNIVVRRDVALTIGGFPEDAAFRTSRAGEDSAFRTAVRRWWPIAGIAHVHLCYRVRPGGHFDRSIDRANHGGPPDADGRTFERGWERHRSAVAHRIAAAAADTPQRTIEVRWGGAASPFKTFDTEPSYSHARSTLEGQVYEELPIEAGQIRSVLDIGANVGAATLLFATRYPRAQILALEPARLPFALLAGNVAAHRNVRAYNVGLYKETVRRPLFAGGPDSVTNSIYRNALSSARTEEIQLVAADYLLGAETFDLIKLDTEGCELDIMTACPRLFAQAKAVYLEYHAEADRLAIDAMLTASHILARGKIISPHRGELLYVNKDAFASAGQRDVWEIRH